MSETQTDIREGKLPFNSGEDLTDKEGHLVKINSDGDVVLPTAITDHAIYLVVSGDVADKKSIVQPFTGERNHRVRTEGIGSAGDLLVLADTGTAADKGKVRKIPTDAGTYRVVAIAEEGFVDDQLVLARPYAGGNIVVN